MNPFQTAIAEWQRIKKWRSRGHRMHGGSKVMKKAGGSEGQCARSSTGFRFRLVHFDMQPSLGEHDGRGKAIRSGSYDACALRKPLL